VRTIFPEQDVTQSYESSKTNGEVLRIPEIFVVFIFAILSFLRYNVSVLPPGAQIGRSEQAGLVRMLLTSVNSPAP